MPTNRRTRPSADRPNEVDLRVRPVVDDFVTSLLTASRVLVGVSARSLAEVEDAVTLTQFRDFGRP